MRMRVIPVRDGRERPAAVNGGLGIVPLEIVGQGDDVALTEVYHVFRRLDLPNAATEDEGLSRAFSTWREALARSGIDLRLERRALYGAPLPHTEWWAHVGGISVRPWDVELTALTAGLRRIVKLDRVLPGVADRLRPAAAERGLQVEAVAPRGPLREVTDTAGFVTLLVARDASTLVEARSLEGLLLAGGGPGATAAALQMGELLGYPRCCVERFARMAEQNDTTLAWALLPGVPHASAPPVTQWLHPGLALLSHSPCDLHCAASISLGARLLDAIDASQDGFALGWRSLAARVQVVDYRGNRLALAVEGRLEAGATITAADVVASASVDPDATTRAEGLVGRTVRSDSGGLVIADGDWHAPYVADHRSER
jgi:hypothetical protein